MTDRSAAGWTLCALLTFFGTYLAFVQRDLLWGSTLITLGCVGYFWVLGRSMVGRWENFRKF